MAQQLFKIEDIEKVMKELKGFEQRVSRRILEKSITKSLVPIRNHARSLVRTRQRKLRKSIRIYKNPRRRTGGKAALWMGSVSGKRMPGNNRGYHAHLIEFGTKGYTITSPRKKKAFVLKDENNKALLKDGKPVFFKSFKKPATKAYPFIAPAFRAKKTEALRIFKQEFDNFLQKELKK